MNDPEIKSVGSVHKLYFGEYNLTIDVDRIHEGSRNETSGEMTIKSLEKYADGFIFQGRQNLLSARSRTETARRLSPNPPKGSGHPEEARDERSRLETAWP